MSEKKHIVVAVPFAREFIYCPFFLTWSAMLMYSKDKYDLSLVTTHGPYIDSNRDELILQAYLMEPDYILFLDDDQTYPSNTPEILMAHDKMVVGGVTPRKESGTPMLWDYKDTVKFWSSLDGKTGLAKVTGMGMAGVLINAKVFYKLEYPYFKMHSKPTYQEMGEDITFYLKCRDAGIDVWADLDLQYGHLTMAEVRIGSPAR